MQKIRNHLRVEFAPLADMRGKSAGTPGNPTNCETMMSDDTMAQDGFEPRPEIETPAPDEPMPSRP